MTNIQAAIGLAQLERADKFIYDKRGLAARYTEVLKDLPVEVHKEAPDTVHSYWMFSILVESAAKRVALRDHLAKDGIETRPVFYPVHTMPMYAGSYSKHPVAEDLAWRGINLPSWPGLSDEKLEQIADSMRSFYNSDQ